MVDDSSLLAAVNIRNSQHNASTSLTLHDQQRLQQQQSHQETNAEMFHKDHEQAPADTSAENFESIYNGTVTSKTLESPSQPLDITQTSKSTEEETKGTIERTNNSDGEIAALDKQAVSDSSNRVVSPDADVQPEGTTDKSMTPTSPRSPSSEKIINVADELSSGAKNDLSEKANEISSHKDQRDRQRTPEEVSSPSRLSPQPNIMGRDDNPTNTGTNSCQDTPRHIISRSPGPKAPPEYSLTPQLLEKARSRLNQSLKPDQIPSKRFLERFQMRQDERTLRRLAKTKMGRKAKAGRKRNFIPLSPTRFQSKFIHPPGCWTNLGMNHVGHNQSSFQNDNFLPAMQMLSNGCRHHNVNYQTLQSDLESKLQRSPKTTSVHHHMRNPPSLPSCLTPPGTPPSKRKQQDISRGGIILTQGSEQAKTELTNSGDTSVASNTAYDYEYSYDCDCMVTVDELTNHFKGQEWTCVFSVAGRWEDGLDIEVSLEQDLNRLLGYRLQFDGKDQGLADDEIGEVGHLLPPLDEHTRMMTIDSDMEGRFNRRQNENTSCPASSSEPVLSFGWQPVDGKSPEMMGLRTYWRDRILNAADWERRDCFVEVTIEASTSMHGHPWSESFPFGDLFGEDPAGANVLNRDLLKDRYSKHGIIIMIHWEMDEADAAMETCHNEFGFFVPTDCVVEGDAAIHTTTAFKINDGTRSSGSQSSVDY